MLSVTIILCILDLVATAAALASYNVSSAQFRSIVEENDVVLVAFVAPWTDSSKALESEWSLAAAQATKPLVIIDCTVESKLCAENGVVSYPAIRLFKDKRSVTRYRGPRKASEILSFVQRSTQPVVSALDSGDIPSFKHGDKYVFIAYLGDSAAEFEDIFTTVATRNHHRFSFGVVSDASLAESENVPIPSIVCYKSQEGEQIVFSGEWGIKSLETWVETAIAPDIGEMTRRTELKWLQAGKSIIYIFALTEEERSNYKRSLTPLAKKYKEYLNFVTVDVVEYGHMALGLGLQADRFPALALQNPMFGQVFPYNQRNPITPDGVENFVLGIAQGRTQASGSGAESHLEHHDEL